MLCYTERLIMGWAKFSSHSAVCFPEPVPQGAFVFHDEEQLWIDSIKLLSV